MHEALATEPAPWPRFYLPILAAGEQAGRTDESLRFLERHCKLLAGPAHAVRNAWLFPLVILLLGTALELGLEKAFERIAYETGEKLNMRMKVVTQVATRITLLMVIGSVIALVAGLML